MLRVVEPPEITKEMLDTMKLHLRIDHDEEDDLIKTLMGATREYAEITLCGRAFEMQTLEWAIGGFAETLVLPMPPLVSIESIEYTTVDGDKVTLDAADYDVNARGEPATVQLNIRLIGPVKELVITYRAGYETPPNEYLLWQKLMVAHYYENRQAILPMGHNIMKTPFAADYLLQSYRMFGVT